MTWRSRFCRTCHGSLRNATDTGVCPSCRDPFHAEDAATTEGRWAVWHPRNWILGFLLATGVAAGTYAIGVRLHFSEALFLLLPFVVGVILALMVPRRIGLLLTLLVLVGPVIVYLTWELGAAGLGCALMLLMIFFVPIMAGGVFVWLVMRSVSRRRDAKRRRRLVETFALLPLTVHLALGFSPPDPEVVTVRTAGTLCVPESEAWRHLVFYEEVEHEAPWLLRLGLPRPLGVSGARLRVGDLETCRYENGCLVKRITERTEEKRLAFQVVEQRLHYERDLRLLDGSFQLEPLPGGRTRLVLTTRYQPRAHPGWLWRRAEAAVISALHEHVIEGIRNRAVGYDLQTEEQP